MVGGSKKYFTFSFTYIIIIKRGKMKSYFIISSILLLLLSSCSDDSTSVVASESTSGCMDALACNYNANATVDDSSCEYSGTCTLSDGTDLSSSYNTPSECNNGGTCWDLTVTGSQMSDLNTEVLCYADASCSSCSNIIMDTNDECSNISGDWTENLLDQAACEAYICVNQDGGIVTAESESYCQSVGVCMNADVNGDGSSSNDQDNQPTNQTDCETFSGYWIPAGQYWVQTGTWTPSEYSWIDESAMIWTNTCE